MLPSFASGRQRLLQWSAALIVILGVAATSARCAVRYVGGNLAWQQYGATFTSAYNSGTMGTYLSEFRNNNLNYIRVWVCENFDGISFSGDSASGISPTLLANVQDFARQANGMGITVEFVFTNYMDVQSHPARFTTYRTALINNALVPLANALKSYNCWIDLINEGPYAVNNIGGWSNLRAFCSQAVSAIRNAGVANWVTMSDPGSSDLVNNLAGTVGGLGFNYYEFHDYNSDGSVNISQSQVGSPPLMMMEYGPGNGWDNNAYSSNKSVLGQFMNNAQANGIQGVAFWSYIGDSNFQLRGNTLMGDIAWWAANFGTSFVTLLDDFENSTDGWTGSNVTGGPWSVTEWAAHGSYSLKSDVQLTPNGQFYLSHVTGQNFSGKTQLSAHVRTASWGTWSGAHAKLYVKCGASYQWTDGGTISIGTGDTTLTLNLSGIANLNDVREIGVQFVAGSTASGQSSIYVDDVTLQ